MKTILFYTPFNSRSRDTETLILAMKKDGFNVIFLTQHEGTEIIGLLKKKGIESYSSFIKGISGKLRIIKEILFLIRFCKRHKVDFIFSHLEPANFIAVFASYFIRAKLFVCRHHSDLFFLMKRKLDFSYRFTYKYARDIIVVSAFSKKHMVEIEGISEKKIHVIPLAYDFSLYNFPVPDNVDKIKKSFYADILLIMVGRLDKYKRPGLSIEVLHELVKRGNHAKLLILGNGTLKSVLQEQVKSLSLSERVFFVGHVEEVLDYMAASDFVLHPSESEASCVVIKEAGLMQKPVIVCSGVGDFDDYLQFGKNGFPVGKDRFVPEAINIILNNYTNVQEMKILGKNLESTVLERFSISEVYPLYKSLLN